MPSSYKSHSWNNIESHYISLIEHGLQHDYLLALVRHIVSTGLTERLFAITSHDRLVISIYEYLEWHKETLHISFDIEKQEWRFEYYAQPNTQAEFMRTYPSETGIKKFDNFITMLRW